MLYNERWHDLQDQGEERYSNVVAKNHEIKITTALNNVYFYTRLVIDGVIQPTTWTVTKNGNPEMVLSDPEDTESELVQQTVQIEAIDTIIRWFYQKEEVPSEVIIN